MKALTINFKLPFGKYKGMTIKEVAKEDFGYLMWCRRELKMIKFNKRILDLIEHKESCVKQPFNEWVKVKIAKEKESQKQAIIREQESKDYIFHKRLQEDLELEALKHKK